MNAFFASARTERDLRTGFTLIELLVVVLIIGILAAIAFPQYQRAVERSRVAALQPLVRNLADAQKRYYMANGDVARSFADLDVALPGDCNVTSQEHYGENAQCGYFSLHPTSSEKHVQGLFKLADGSWIYIFYDGVGTGYNGCMACGDGENNRAEQLCLNLGGVYKSTGNCPIYSL